MQNRLCDSCDQRADQYVYTGGHVAPAVLRLLIRPLGCLAAERLTCSTGTPAALVAAGVSLLCAPRDGPTSVRQPFDGSVGPPPVRAQAVSPLKPVPPGPERT